MRDTWAVAPALSGFVQDLRYALRTLHRSPGFAVVVAVTLGLGIGINTATFSIINAALIKPLGFADPDRLIAIQEQIVGYEFDEGPFSPPDFLDVQREQRSFTGIGAFLNLSLELSEGEQPVRVDAAKMSWSLFPLLGVPPLTVARSIPTRIDRVRTLPYSAGRSGRRASAATPRWSVRVSGSIAAPTP